MGKSYVRKDRCMDFSFLVLLYHPFRPEFQFYSTFEGFFFFSSTAERSTLPRMKWLWLRLVIAALQRWLNGEPSFLREPFTIQSVQGWNCSKKELVVVVEILDMKQFSDNVDDLRYWRVELITLKIYELRRFLCWLSALAIQVSQRDFNNNDATIPDTKLMT